MLIHVEVENICKLELFDIKSQETRLILSKDSFMRLEVIKEEKNFS